MSATLEGRFRRPVRVFVYNKGDESSWVGHQNILLDIFKSLTWIIFSMRLTI